MGHSAAQQITAVVLELSSVSHSCGLLALDAVATVHSDQGFSHGNSHTGMLLENNLISLMKSSSMEDSHPSGISHKGTRGADAEFSGTHLISHVHGPGSSFITWGPTSSHCSRT